MSQTTPSRFEQIRERRMQSPEFRDRYHRTRRSIATVQEVIELIDAQRREAGLSKAALARRAGINPAALRRLLTSRSSNPTLQTVVEVLNALGMRMRVEAEPVSSAEAKPSTRGGRAAAGMRRHGALMG